MNALRELAWLAGAALLSVSLAAHGDAARRERREAAGFDRIVLRAAGELRIEQGNDEGLVVEAEARVLPKVRAHVEAGTLYIELADGVATQQPLRYYVKAKRLRGITAEASGDISAGALQNERLDVLLSGSGTLTIAALSAQELRVRIAGSAHVSVSGAVREQSISIEGAGEYAAARLVSGRARVAISGSGSAQVNAHDDLDADISGSGTVTYSGNPRVRRQVTGAGSVERG